MQIKWFVQSSKQDVFKRLYQVHALSRNFNRELLKDNTKYMVYPVSLTGKYLKDMQNTWSVVSI